MNAFRRARDIDQNNGEANDGLRRAETALKQSKMKDWYKILGTCRLPLCLVVLSRLPVLVCECAPNNQRVGIDVNASLALTSQV